MVYRTVVRPAAALLGALSVVLAGCGGANATARRPASGTPPVKTCERTQAKASDQPSTAPLKIGTLLPETGSLSFLGPPEIAAVNMAIKEINAAGGVLGQPVITIRGDSGDDKTNTANQTVDRELGQGVQAIIGAAASGITQRVINKITSAGVVEVSPANTSDELTCWPDRGLYFRTAPPDSLQAKALTALMTGDGAHRISLLARDDSYGNSLATDTVRELRAAGMPRNRIQKIIYDPRVTAYRTEIDDIRQFNPDAIAVIGFDESKKLLIRMSGMDIGPDHKLVYGTDGNMGNALGVGLPPGLLGGMKGIRPATALPAAFLQQLRVEDPKLADTNYAGEAYDAVMIVALAAERARSTKGVDIASEINEITKGDEQCTTFRQCRDIVDHGGDPAYTGVTGPLSFTTAGERAAGCYAILKFTAQNKIDEAAIRYRLVIR